MQAPAPQPIRLHWSPVEPSWLVAAGLAILTVLPHQIPAPFRKFLRSSIGALLFLALAIFVSGFTPVLGVAMFLLMVSVRLQGPRVEGFAPGSQGLAARAMHEGFYAPTLVQDAVRERKQRWQNEEIMSEDPHAIQERTDSPGIIVDTVSEPAKRWFSEEIMEETPLGIQDRPVPTVYEGRTEYAQAVAHSHK